MSIFLLGRCTRGNARLATGFHHAPVGVEAQDLRAAFETKEKRFDCNRERAPKHLPVWPKVGIRRVEEDIWRVC